MAAPCRFGTRAFFSTFQDEEDFSFKTKNETNFIKKTKA
jgi:hypothetical protein